MGIGAAIAACAGSDSDGSSFLNPLLRREDEAVQPSLHSNPVEFDGIKTGVVESLPNSEKLDRAASAQPVPNHIIRVVRILEFGDVCQAKDILLVLRKHGYSASLNFDTGAFGFAHG